MSLDTAWAAARSDLDNFGGWLRNFAEKSAPAVDAEIQRLQGSPIIQILESVVLTPAEEAMIAKIISELPTLRPGGPQSVPAVAEPPAQPEVPADVAAAPADVAEPAAQPA